MASSSSSSTNWRDSVPQQYRSDEISKIASELSALEPNTTATSKLGLASKFEDSVFKSASSLNDYHKRIQKRLKKLKRNYERNNQATAAAATATNNNPNANNGTASGGGIIGNENENTTAIEEKNILLKRQLRSLYGDTMRLIASNGQIAAAGYPRLIDHIDKSNEYALDIGAISSDLGVKVATKEKIVLVKRSPKDMLDYLKDLEVKLEQKMTTLREWILKYSKEEKYV